MRYRSEQLCSDSTTLEKKRLYLKRLFGANDYGYSDNSCDCPTLQRLSTMKRL